MNNIEKYSLLIADTLKEVFILLTALVILINYMIRIKELSDKSKNTSNTNTENTGNNENSNNTTKTGNTENTTNTSTSDHPEQEKFTGLTINDIRNYVKEINEDIFTFLSNALKKITINYFIYIFSLYIFSYIISVRVATWASGTTNKNNILWKESNNKNSNLFENMNISKLMEKAKEYKKTKDFETSYTEIYNDFKIKIFFVILFPLILVISISILYSILYLTWKIHSSRYTNYKYLAYIGSISIIWTFFSFLIILFISFATKKRLDTLYESLFKYWWAMLINIILYIISFVFILIVIFAGIYKIIGFSLYSTFVLKMSNILHILLCLNSDLKMLLSALKILLAIFVLYNITQLFPFIYFVFAAIVFSIMTFYVLKDINTIKIEPCEPINTT